MCKARGVKGTRGKSKTELIAMLGPNPTPPTEPVATTTPPEPVATPVATKNVFEVGDNLELLKGLADESMDMIYLDPPFNTGRDFYYFQDKFADFNQFMHDRLTECCRALKKDGNIIVHVEPRISHHIRVICDRLFGESNFKNEIVWHSGGNSKNKYQLGRITTC